MNAGGELQTLEMYDEPEDEDSYYREGSETSEASSKSVTESRVSRTGDSSHTAVYAIVAVCAAGAVLLLLRKKHRK